MLRRRLIVNTIASYAGTLSRIAVAFLLVPLVIQELGAELYGVWTLILAAFGFLTLIDLGLANGLAKFTAECAARDEHERVGQMAGMVLLVFGGFGTLAAIGLTLLAEPFGRFFAIPPTHTTDAQRAIFIISISLVLTLILSVYNAVGIGYQQFVVINGGLAISQILLLISTWIVLRLEWGIVGLAIVHGATTVVQWAWFGWHLWRGVGFRPKFTRPQSVKIAFTPLLAYSATLFVIITARQIELNAAPAIVGRFATLEAVTLYAVGVKVSTLTFQLTIPMTQALFPAFAELHTTGDQQRLGVLLLESLRISTLVGALVATGAIVLAQPLITIWVGEELTDATAVAQLLTGQAIMVLLLQTISSLLMGIGRLRRYAQLVVIGVVFSLGVGVVGIGRFGIAAIAWGSLLAWVAIFLGLLPYTARLANVPFTSILRFSLLPPILVALPPAVLLSWLSAVRPPTNWIELGLFGAVGGVVYLVGAWLFCLTSAERTRTRHLLARLI